MEKNELKKILIVDDDPDIIVITEFSLSAIPNLEITCVSSGEEAIKKAIEIIPDLILLDLMMPNMDGRSTLKALKLIPSTKDIPVVFFTAKINSKDTEEYKKLGIIDVIVKPFDPMTLPSVIGKIWDNFQNLKKCKCFDKKLF